MSQENGQAISKQTQTRQQGYCQSTYQNRQETTAWTCHRHNTETQRNMECPGYLKEIVLPQTGECHY